MRVDATTPKPPTLAATSPPSIGTTPVPPTSGATHGPPTKAPKSLVFPTKAPSTPAGCVLAEIDFNELPDGTVLDGSKYIQAQHKPFYGL